jgi:hypothetical protein
LDRDRLGVCPGADARKEADRCCCEQPGQPAPLVATEFEPRAAAACLNGLNRGICFYISFHDFMFLSRLIFLFDFTFHRLSNLFLPSHLLPALARP